MKIPQLETGLVIEATDNPTHYSFHIATEFARKWFLEEALRFTHEKHQFTNIREDKLPVRATLAISPCYNKEEVLEYLNSPNFEPTPE